MESNVRDLFLNRQNVTDAQKIAYYEKHVYALYQAMCEVEKRSIALEKEIKALSAELKELERKYYDKGSDK